MRYALLQAPSTLLANPRGGSLYIRERKCICVRIYKAAMDAAHFTLINPSSLNCPQLQFTTLYTPK